MNDNYNNDNYNNDNYNLAVLDEDTDYVADLTSRTTSYCSLIAESAEDKAKIYNAMNNPEKRIKDCINEVIDLTDVYVESVVCTNEAGISTTCPRVVLIDKDGVGYQAVSKGIFGALKKLFAIFGEPKDWEAPISIKIKQMNRGTNKAILTFDIVA